jgi:hypothetical protein
MGWDACAALALDMGYGDCFLIVGGLLYENEEGG